MATCLKLPCNKEFGIDNNVAMFEVKLLVPSFIVFGNLLYPLPQAPNYIIEGQIKFKN